MRTFIAIDLDPEIKNSLSQLIDELASLDKGKRNIKWVSRQGMHLTLKFLGEIEEKKAREVENTLKKTAEKSSSFLLRVRGTGFFPPQTKYPRVLWVGVEEEETLLSLQSHLESEMEKAGFPREQRKFHPHLTLGRVKNPSFLSETLSLLEKYKDTIFGEMRAEKITFFQSVLKPSGAEYSVISEYKLK